MNTPTKPMDIETVRSILCDMDQEKYHQESQQKQTNDDVWPPQLEDAFIEAVYVFATVGQKKYQVEEAYSGGTNVELIGRNDIISRYIFMKTGQFRARKQVSSHIQVWAHCKKPPSSRDMKAAEFDQFKDMFRRHYSRATSEAGLCRRRIRRVASTSDVTLAKKALSRNALGIHSDPVFADGDRKRNSMWESDNSAKRCRRVVSELPPLAYRLTSDSSDSASEQSVHEPSCTYAPWTGSVFDPRAFAGPQEAPPPLSLMLPHTPFAAHASGFVPTFDAADPSHAMYDLGIATPVDPSVTAFTAATFAAMAGFDSACVTPAINTADFMTDSLAPSTLFPLHQPKSACSAADAISAFASAVGTECLSQPFPPELTVATTDGSYLPQAALHPWSQPVFETDAASPCEPQTHAAASSIGDACKDAHSSEYSREPSVCLDVRATGSTAEWLQSIRDISETLKREHDSEPRSDCDDTFDWHSILSQYLQSIG
ncbi:hypothetical protein GGH96_004739 [Coemansia sp. RSA 1972]|nr:hypothetical protein GGH96_004739 [Coemansia sp. RSA 1972]